MLRRTPIFTALEPQLIGSGIYKDAHAILQPLWADAEHVEFVEGKVRHRREDRRLLKVGEGLCRGVGQQFLSNRERVLWAVIGSTLWRWDIFSLREIMTLPSSGLNSPYVDFTFYGDWAFINRGIGSVSFWNGEEISTVAEMPTNVRQLQKMLSFLVAVGTGSKRTGVSWSDANNVQKWNPSATNSAGALYFDEFSNGIIASEMLGPVLAVYSDNQMGVMSFIGSPFYFGKKTLLSGIGAVGPEALSAVGQLNYGFGRQGPWRTDGQEFQYIDAGKMHDFFQDSVNWEVASKIIVARNDVLRTVEFYLPVEGSTELNQAWSFDPASGGWSEIPPASFFSEDMLFELPIRVDLDSQINLAGGRDFNTADLVLQTKPLVMQVQTQHGLTDVHFATKVDEVELMLKAAQNVRMRIGTSNTPDGAISWSSYIQLSPQQSTYLVPAGVPVAPYWHLEFSSAVVPETVVQGAETVVEGAEVVTSVTPVTSWKFNLQGFLLFGAIEGAQ